MYIKTKLAVITTTIALATAFSAPTQAALETASEPHKPVSSDTAPIKAVDSPAIDFSKIDVTTTPAEPTPEPSPEPVVAEVQEAPVEPVLPAQPEPVAPEPRVVAPQAQVPAPAPAVVAAPSGKGQAVASAALGQLGVMQDCTMLVTNSLKAVGINFHGWPVEYYSLGYAVSAAEAQPGDLIYYSYGVAGQPNSLAHIAVYIGNGQAVHGGWNGNQTIVFSANVGSGPSFIRLY